MRWRWKLLIVAALVMAAAYGELVLDIRTPRAALVELHAVRSNNEVFLSDLVRADAAMKKKYGPEAETSLSTRPRQLTTRVGGKIVEQEKTGQIADAVGLFVIGPPGRTKSTFPFQIKPREAPESVPWQLPDVRHLATRVTNELPAMYFEFDVRDTMVDRCLTILPADVGWVGRQLRFQSGAFCLVRWKGAAPASMLIGVAVADGDPWMRPFTRRLCRGLTALALERAAGKPLSDYAACVLIDRPDRTEAAETLQTYVYEVRRDATLASAN